MASITATIACGLGRTGTSAARAMLNWSFPGSVNTGFQATAVIFS
jgi:hypothetical protein